ncbi:MAG: acyltransferase family protein [Sciscionella sp.]
MVRTPVLRRGANSPIAPADPAAGRTASRAARFSLLDGLRICAATMVMLYHFTALDYRAHPWGRSVSKEFPRLWHVTAYGALGVQLFFIISGFVILMSSWGRTLPQFVASRVSRLYPAYWLALGLSSLLLLVIWRSARHITASQLLVNTTMLQGSQRVSDVESVYWTLWVEICFYFLISLLVLVGITANRVMAFAALWPIAGAFAANSHSALLVSVLQPQYAPLFAGGMLLHLIYREGHSTLPWLLVGMNVVLSIHATVDGMFHRIEVNTHHSLSKATCAVLLVIFFAAVAAVTLTRLRRIRWRWLTWAGILTYPLYLIHEYWGLWLIHELRPHLSTWPTLVLTMVAMLALAWVIHQLAERPFHARLRRAIERSLVKDARRTPIAQQ